MKSKIGVIIVSVLAVLGGLGGFMATSGYYGYVGFNEGAIASCKMLAVAESKALLTPAQRREVALFAMQPGQGGEAMADYFVSDCAQTPFQYMAAKAKVPVEKK